MRAAVRGNCPLAYDEALNLFCRESALFEHYALCQEAGLKISDRELKRSIEAMKLAKENLLIEKQNLGYDDEFDFAKEPLYSSRGFELVKSRLTGRLDNVVSAVEGWRNVDKVTKKNHFKFEQATLVLSHYYMQTGQYRMRGRYKVIFRNLAVKVILWTRKKNKEKEGSAA